jgi:hypothetical protein
MMNVIIETHRSHVHHYISTGLCHIFIPLTSYFAFLSIMSFFVCHIICVNMKQTHTKTISIFVFL